MNPPSPTTPSPLVPQGSIAPRNGSRSGRVLLIALTVVAFHLAGLGVVLMQGCQKDNKTSGLGSAEPTNNTALTYPENTNNSIFSPATNVGATSARTATNPSTMAGTSPGMGAIPAAPTNVGLSAPIPGPGSGIAESPLTPSATATDVGATTDYKIVAGDNLGKIASKNHITLSALTKANPGLDPRKLQPGKTIKIPAVPLPSGATMASTASTGSTSVTPRTATAAPIAGASGTYKVKSGDTLTKIAKANGITVSQLRAANNLKTSQLLAGKILKIPARSTAEAPAAATNH